MKIAVRFLVSLAVIVLMVGPPAQAGDSLSACSAGNPFKAPDQVIKTCNAALTLSTVAGNEKAAVLAQIGEAQYWKGQQFDAIQSLQSALLLDPSLNESRIQLGWAHLRSGDEAAAMAIFKEAEIRNPHSPRTAFAAGYIADSHGRIDDAVSFYREALKRDPDYTLAHENLAVLYENNFGDAEKATAELDAILKLGRTKVDAVRSFGGVRVSDKSDNYDNVLLRKAQMLAHLGRIDDAEEIFSKLQVIYPDAPNGWDSLAEVKFRQGKYDEVIAVANKGIDHGCICASGWAMVALYHTARYKEALAMGEKIMALSKTKSIPADSLGSSMFFMGALEKRAGDKDAAYKYLVSALHSGSIGSQYVLTAVIGQRFYSGTPQDQLNDRMDSALRACILDKDCLVSDSDLGFLSYHVSFIPPQPMSEDLTSGKDKDGLSKACLGEITVLLPANAFKPCQDLADQQTTTAHDKSHIYLRLAISSENPQVIATDPEKQWGMVRRGYYETALQADPTNVDAYFYMAWQAIRQHDTESEEPMQILASGLTMNPDAPRLLAELAAVDYFRRGPYGVRDLCTKALSAAPDDRLVMIRCASAYAASDMQDDAFDLYQKLAPGYDRKKPDLAGIEEPRNPSMEVAKILNDRHEPRKAAETLDAYIARVPAKDVFFDEWLADGEYHDQAQQFREAAKAFHAAETASNPFPIAETKVKELVALAQAGEGDEAQKLAGQISSDGNQKAVLWLQVRLRNSGDRSLPITGLYDDTTRNSIDRCVANQGCTPG